MHSEYSHRLAYIVTCFLQSVAYGMNIISFWACMLTLLTINGKMRPRRTIPWLMLCVAILMFAIATADSVVEVQYLVALFASRDPRATLEFWGIFQWWSIVAFSLYVVQTWLGELILIYRCFVVWNRKLAIIAFSLVTSTAGLAFGISATVIGGLGDETNKSTGNLLAITISFYALAMATNIVTSSLIVCRIWNVKKGSLRYRSFTVHANDQDPLARAIRVTIEAGLIYTVSLIGLLITYLCFHTSQFAVQRIVVQMIGITFNLIIVNSQRRTDDPRDSASFKRFSAPPMAINKDVVSPRDPPSPLIMTVAPHESVSEANNGSINQIHESPISDSAITVA
ncbi:hypothetical protein H0H93_007749 [Arthromyces matolae]|nr:hypothetical protein H0H93_007749 [Arthromyces matolae]